MAEGREQGQALVVAAAQRQGLFEAFFVGVADQAVDQALGLA